MKTQHKFTKDYLNTNPELRDQLLYLLEGLFTFVPPGRLRNTLLEVYHTYISTQHSMGFPLDFDYMSEQMHQLQQTLCSMDTALSMAASNGSDRNQVESENPTIE